MCAYLRLDSMADLVLVVAALSLVAIYLVRAFRSAERRRYHLIGATGFGFLAFGGFFDGELAIVTLSMSVAVLGAALLLQRTNREETSSNSAI